MHNIVVCIALVVVASCGSKKTETSDTEQHTTAPKTPATPTTDTTQSQRADHERELRLICDSAKAASEKDGDKRLAFASSLEGKLKTSAIKNIFEATGAIEAKHADAALRQGALELGVRDWTCPSIAAVFGSQEATTQFVHDGALRMICEAAEKAISGSGSDDEKRAAFDVAVAKQDLVPFFRDAMKAVAESPDSEKRRTLEAHALEFGVKGWRCDALDTLYRPVSVAGPVKWDGVCEAYAKQCDQKSSRTRASLAKDRRKCEATCNAADFKSNKEMCTFIYCGVKTKTCDNENSDEPILECLKLHGWN